MLGITALILGLMAITTVVVRSRVPAKYAPYFPNWTAMGIAFVVPSVSTPFAMVCGAIAAFFVKKHKPELWNRFGYPLAAGLAAGEACAGLFNAGLVIAGVDGGKKGTMFGCPYGDC
jgi:uncharacterized oligopeptide transporter (OPT) family protein